MKGCCPNWLSQQNHRTRRLKTEGDNSARQILNLVSFVCFCGVGFRPQITIRKERKESFGGHAVTVLP
jgi:hypothetical protein